MPRTLQRWRRLKKLSRRGERDPRHAAGGHRDRGLVVGRGPCRPEEHPATPQLSAPKDQRTEYAYIFGAICPETGKGAGLVLPRCNVQAMNAHLVEIRLAVAPGAQAVLILDGAGWHIAGDLVVPDNITLMPLPARAPELNAVENVWQFIRDNWLGDRVFASYEDILDHCCHAWNRLIEQPWKIMSIGLRQWAYQR